MDSQELSGEEKYRLEQKFQNTRSQVIRTHITILIFLLASLILFFFAPDQHLLIGVAILWITGGLVLFWYNRKYWRCPSCSQRWKVPHLLTSHYWEFCPKCGVPLKRVSTRPHYETFEKLPKGEIQTKFERNQKVRNMLASTGIPIIFILWGSLQSQNLSTRGLGIIVISAGIVFLGTYLYLSRCTNCQKGIIMHRDTFCTRCGVKFKSI